MLGVQAERAGEWSVIHVSGEIDMATAPRLRQALVAEIDGGCRSVVVDLSGVQFVDSTGLGVLIGALVRARRVGGDLTVTGLSPRVRELFDIVALDRVLAVVERPDPATSSTESATGPDLEGERP
jgi:anti-sigma B factor antagonist